MKVTDLLTKTSFPEPGMEGWLALVRKTLGDARFEDVLTSRTDDGIAINPLEPRVRNSQPTATRANPSAPWAITQRIDDPDPTRANRQALEDMDQGATGLALVFEGAPNAFGSGLPAKPEALAIALHNVPLQKAYVRIDAHPASRASVDWLMALAGKRRLDPSKLSVSFGIDPAAIFGGTGRLRMSVEALKASMPQSLAHFFALGLPGILLEGDGRVFHNAGATEAQELGIAIASAVSHLRMFEEARQPLLYAAPHIGFSLAVDQDQFVSIAKLRAIRALWARVGEACSIAPSAISVHAETSYRMMTRKDPETNILRTTIAAFAAAGGGADSIAILPHTVAHGLPVAFARRIARNTQLILAGESHIDFVADPAAGSGNIEALTDALCEKAWDEFRRIESEGGVLDSLAAGKIQSRISQARKRRAEEYSSGRRHVIGTTLFPASRERPVKVLDVPVRTLGEEGAAICERLEPIRIDQMIEDAQ